ncbi:MAG: hypothetical protein ICV66_11140, partial [Chitinophagaceae bacterium]|nr:hypothetical protein [Chitinophagaceae bacterium]
FSWNAGQKGIVAEKETETSEIIFKNSGLVAPVTIAPKVLNGHIEFYSGNIKKGIPYYQEWFKVDPESPWVRFNYSWVLAMNNEIEESIRILDAMIKGCARFRIW